MKLKFLTFFFCLATQTIFSYDVPVFGKLESELCKLVSEQHGICGQVVEESFKAYHDLMINKAPLVEFMQNEHVKALFLLDTQDLKFIGHCLLTDEQQKDMHCRHTKDQRYNAIYQAQNLMLVYLYGQFFKAYITRSQEIIETLVQAKEYWVNELFLESLSLSRQMPDRWIRSKEYKQELRIKINVLQREENRICTMLGIALYGHQQILKIACTDDIDRCVVNCIEPVYKNFNAPLRDMKTMSYQGKHLYYDYIGFVAGCFKDIKNGLASIKEYKKPHHIIRHKYTYALTIVSIATLFYLYKYQHNYMVEYIDGGKKIWNVFMQDYFFDPISAFKRMFGGDGNPIPQQHQPPKIPKITTSIAKFKATPELPEISSGPLSARTLLGINAPVNQQIFAINRFFNVLMGDANNTRIAVNKIIGEINDVGDVVNKGIENAYADVNQAREYTQNNYKATLFIVSVLPAIFVGYLVYKGACAGYQRFIKHDSWYHPMKLIVWSIDTLLNKILTKEEHSFCDDGKMFFFIMRLKSYKNCLSNEELFLFKESISQLLSFDLSYKEKHGVLERMYRTFEFLK